MMPVVMHRRDSYARGRPILWRLDVFQDQLAQDEETIKLALDVPHPAEDFLLFVSLKSHRLIAGWPVMLPHLRRPA